MYVRMLVGGWGGRFLWKRVGCLGREVGVLWGDCLGYLCLCKSTAFKNLQ